MPARNPASVASRRLLRRHERLAERPHAADRGLHAAVAVARLLGRGALLGDELLLGRARLRPRLGLERRDLPAGVERHPELQRELGDGRVAGSALRRGRGRAGADQVERGVAGAALDVDLHAGALGGQARADELEVLLGGELHPGVDVGGVGGDERQVVGERGEELRVDPR